MASSPMCSTSGNSSLGSGRTRSSGISPRTNETNDFDPSVATSSSGFASAMATKRRALISRTLDCTQVASRTAASTHPAASGSSAFPASKTTLPLRSTVFTLVYPRFSKQSVSLAMGTGFAVPTLMPRSSATFLP